VAGDFRERLVEEVGRLGVTDPSLADCVVGPLIDADARSSAQRAIERLDGSLLAGGDAVGGQSGWYLEPTLLELDWRAQGQTDEIFAPVATVAEVPDAGTALAAANMGPLGLAAAVFTTRLDHAMAVADRLDAGLVRINAPTSGVDYHVPFGGLKASSIGPREQGPAAQEFFTKERTILVDPGTAALQ
jgi:aldehyde dehydrogenase (NAD+)